MNRKYLIYLCACGVGLVIVLALSIKSCVNSIGTQDDGALPDAEVRTDTIRLMVARIQQCSRLNTAEVKVHKIITHDDKPRISGTLFGKKLSVDIPAGKRKVAIPLYATVVASIDLTEVTADDIVRDGNTIEVFLPQPKVEITETHIDHDGIKQYVAFTRSNFSDEELQTYERQGREAISRDLKSLGVENMARESAARQVIPIIQMLGFDVKDITISFRNDNGNKKIIRTNR